jgi:hypothetical protein
VLFIEPPTCVASNGAVKKIAVANHNALIDWDDGFSRFDFPRLTKPDGTTSGLVFGSNSFDSVAILCDPSIDGTTDNGTRNSIITGSGTL